MSFVHLHTHSHYSLLDGLPKIGDLVAKAKKLNMNALALTDHGVLYGAIEFFQKATEAGIKPIIGVEAYVAKNGMYNKRSRVDDRPYHLILLAKNQTGYQNLLSLVTKAHLEGFYYKPRIDWELLQKHSKGLIAMTACLQGEIPSAIRNSDLKHAEELIKNYAYLFGEGNFYLELQHHPSIEQQQRVNDALIGLGKKLNVPLVATNDVHYLEPADAYPQDVLLCIQMKRKQEETDRISYVGEDFSLKTLEQMARDFSHVPEAIENTVKIAEKCNLDIEFGKIMLPHFETPKEKNADEYLRELCYQGISKRFGINIPSDPAKQNINDDETKKIIDRLEYELTVIHKTGFASYFLIVQDFVNWAKSNKIVVGPGRGSAAGSIVSYVLNITNLDPLHYELMFERFLNPERISMPDIDIDFADSRRNEVITYVEEKYGKDHVAQIITFGTMAARAAIRDVGRVQGLPYNFCDQVAKMIPMFMTLDDALKAVPELKSLYSTDPEAKKLIDTAKKLEGVARHTSTHACGIVIAPDPLEMHVPTQYASQDDKTIITQYSLNPIEDLGLLKMDFLGLKNLTILENALDIIFKTTGEEIDIDKIPLDDKNAFKLFQKGDTIGVFQLESSGMTRYLKELKPTDLEDIIAMVSLYRPGPMELIPDYIAGKRGKKKISYLHPKLEPILNKTYGIAVYQEQILQIARDLCGFTLGEADILRKAIGKKIRSLLMEQREKFVQGAINNGIQKRIAEKLFDFVEPFAEYGFNRSHAACYAMIAYQTAYLKANWPAQFLAALLTADYGNTDRIAVEVAETKKHGIEVVPPDVNESFSTFTVVKESLDTEQPRIRFGLMAIKNIGTNIVRTIIDERKKDGKYQNLEDFLRRVQTKDLNKKSLESLIKCGAMDDFGNRQTLLDNLESILIYAKNSQRERLNGQTNLFGMLPAEHSPKLRLTESEPVDKKTRLGWEKQLLGMYISEHPLDDYREQLEKLTSPINTLSKGLKRNITVGGIITSIKKIITKTNEQMLFVTLEDLTGAVEIIVFPSTLKDNHEIWAEDKMLLVTGKVNTKEGIPKLICEKVKEFDGQANYGKPEVAEKKIHVEIANLEKETLDKLKIIFENNPGEYKVFLAWKNGGSPKIISTKTAISISDETVAEIETIVGSGAVKISD
ncbi:MAG: DNA polymerase III subunit alpha [Patescibacteria group bacterium]